MTSVSSGLSRPPNHSHFPSGLPVSAIAPSKKSSPAGDIDLTLSGDFDGRPTKKRKIDASNSGSSSPAQIRSFTSTGEDNKDTSSVRYLPVSWAKAVELRPESERIVGDAKELPPFPERPWGPVNLKENGLSEARDPCRRRADLPVPTSPDSIITPSEKSLQHGGRPPGYFPWIGKHPEDVLNDTNVKQGYYDRPPNPPEKELNTAKAPLYNAFKHRSGLESLSTLFTLVLDQKNKHGTLSSASSFKPPARVTLTEAKRKSWISDLANPEVPLRRLSRTIPQGIRGQLLLDQCLSHEVPFSRAIWFIRCVGANDIRTLKRKGVTSTIAAGAESKWLKDWTCGVEQFLESILNQCGQSNWQHNFQYAIRLCTRLYLDNMMDRDHYLDWIVRSLNTADAKILPFWLMLAHLHKSDLIRFRKRAKQLASILIAKHEETKLSPSFVMRPLTDRLRMFLRWMVMSKPGCFLMPDQWQQCEQTLLSCLNLEHVREKRMFKQIKANNERATGTASSSVTDAPTPEEKIISLLDRVRVPFDIDNLSSSLHESSLDIIILFNTCLDWCISSYRAGSARVYLIARLMRRWQKCGNDLDKIMFDFLATPRDQSGLEVATFKHLFAELSRSKTISISRYMQWLTVRGYPLQKQTVSLDGRKALSKSLSDDCELLTEVCLVNGHDHIINLRNGLLGKAGYDLQEESTILSKCIADVTSLFNELDRPKDIQQDCVSFLSRIRKINWSMKFTLSQWLRGQVVEFAKSASIEIPGKPPLPGARSFTVAHFSIIRKVMESLDDIPVLADILRLLSNVKQEAVLAALVDTINYHAKAFSSIGALEPLQTLYCQTYLALRAIRPSILLFTTSLLDLCIQFPHKLTPTRALEHDFVRGDRGRAVAAYSPFSDSMAELLGQAGATFLDDFEAVLQAETAMNEHIMLSLFTVLTERIAKCDKDDLETHEALVLGQLLSRLKLVRKVQGEALIQRWLTRWLSDLAPPTTRTLLILITTRSITVETLLEVACQLPSSPEAKTKIFELLNDAVAKQEQSTSDDDLWYSLKLGLKQFVDHKPEKAISLLLQPSTTSQQNSSVYTELLIDCVIDGNKYNQLSRSVQEKLSSLINKMLPSGTGDEENIDSLVQQANPLSLPLYKLRLQDVCQKISSSNDVDAVGQVAEAMVRSFLKYRGASASKTGVFRTLLHAAGPEVGAKLKQITDQGLAEALPKFLQARMPGTPNVPTADEKQRFAQAVDQLIVLGSALDTDGTPSGINFLIDKLTILMKYFAGKTEATPLTPSTANVTTPTPASTVTGSAVIAMDVKYKDFLLECLDFLTLLLQVTCLKRPAYKSLPAIGNATIVKHLQQEQIKLAAIIASLAVMPSFSQLWTYATEDGTRGKIRETLTFALDVAATLIDNMADESRLMCARVLKDRLKDERVQWLVGSVNMFGSTQSQELGHSLQMVHENKGMVGEFRPKIWEMLESGAGHESDTCLGLGLFGATRN